MEVGEQDQARAQKRVFGGQRLFDLENEVGLLPDRFGGFQDMRASRDVVRIREAAPGTGPGLDHDAVPVRHQGGDAAGRDGDAGFLGFDFLGDADDHHSFSCGQGLVKEDSRQAFARRSQGL